MKLQDYLLKKSDSIGAIWMVFFGALLDSIFLFIPPEVFMTPPIIANKNKAKITVFAASVGSLIGAIIMYMIGAWLYDSVGHWIINIFSSPEQFALAQELFDKHGIMIILIASFTPIPFKILTLCAGFLGFAPLLYLSFTAVGRTLRFIISGWLLWRFQEKANSIVKKYFWWLLLGAVLITCLGLLILRFV